MTVVPSYETVSSNSKAAGAFQILSPSAFHPPPRLVPRHQKQQPETATKKQQLRAAPPTRGDMAYILVGDAGWASMQADCHRFMRFLIEINNGFAQNPNYDFHAFRAAVDGIVRDEIGRRTAQPVMCTLRILVFDVLRCVWMCIHPCKLTFVRS